MAANSSGVEWGSIVKPILAASYGSFNKNDVAELAKAIIKSEAELLAHDEKYETFYTTFAALAADYISSNVNTVCKSGLGVTCQACHALMKFLLSRMSQQQSSSQLSMVQTKQLVLPLKALCTAKSSLPRSDQIALTTVMKNASLPPHIKTSMPADMSGDNGKESGGGGSSKDSAAGVGNSGKVRSRTDLSNLIMEQLTSPLLDYTAPAKRLSIAPAPALGDQPAPEPKAPPHDHPASDRPGDLIETVFIQRNIMSLKSLGAGDILIDMYLQLPHLARFVQKYKLALDKRGFSLPSTLNEAQLIRHSLQAIVNDMSVVWSGLSLPVLEPLTPARLEKITTVAMTCLYCALSAATASSIVAISSSVSPKTVPNSSSNTGKPSSEEEANADALATNVVEKALEIFNLILNVIRSSSRTGGHVVQNYILMGAWVLVSGLQAQLAASSQAPTEKCGKEEKGKSPSKSRDSTSARINLNKVQQGFGVLSVALASQALNLMGQLLEDVQYEHPTGNTLGSGAANLSLDQVELSTSTIMAHLTSIKRAATLLSAVPLNQFLFYLATVSYRKACTLKRIQKHPPEGDTFSTSDSTTYYEDEMSSEESSPDPDDDSEPLLGLWFEETISVPDSENGSNNQTQDNQDNSSKPLSDGTSSIVPEKGEPNGFILLASQIFQVMNKYMVVSDSPYLTQYVESGLAEQQMIMLAAIIRDLDRETARTDIGTISVYFGATLGALYSEFSHALTQYTHNLLAENLLSESLQSTLLFHLGVHPHPSEPPGAPGWTQTPPPTTGGAPPSPWPLQVYPRTLAVLAQVLLLKPQAEKEAACISIWHRLISTLVDSVVSTNPSIDSESEEFDVADMNVEHAQLVLFLFHSLNLMQKKSVLLCCASGVVKAGGRLSGEPGSPLRETQLLHLSRLLLLLDYLVKHLYDAPPALLEQVQWNLFSGTSLMSSDAGEPPTNLASRIFCPCSEIEDNYRKFMPGDEFSMRPRFYSLTYGDINNQEPPKLDGLACNFILGNPDKVKYPTLIDALLDILNVTNLCTPAILSTEKISYTTLCAVQYCFMIAWRLLLQLPPSTLNLEKLAQGNLIDASPILLHSLIWGPRTAHKTFIPWLKDCLVKQGMYTQYAEAVLKNVADVVNNLSYDINLAKHCIASLIPQIENSGFLVPKRDLPTIMELCLLDSVIAKVQAAYDHSSKSPDSDSKTVRTIAGPSIGELIQLVLRLTDVILSCSRSSIMYQISETTEGGGLYTVGDLSAFRSILAISSTKCVKTQSLAVAISALLPAPVCTVLDKWNANAVSSFPWNEFANDILPGESYVMSVVMKHISALSSNNVFTINPPLKHLLHSLVSFVSEHITKLTESHVAWPQAVTVLAPLTIDACTDYLHDIAIRILEKVNGDQDSENHQAVIYSLVLEHIYTLILNYTSATSPCSEAVNEKILHECLSWIEGLLEKPAGRQAMDKFFDTLPERDLVQVLLSVSSPRTSLSPTYGARVLQFFNKLFTTAEKANDEHLDRLCGSAVLIANVESSQLSYWLHHVILGPGAKKGSFGGVFSPCSSSSSSSPGEGAAGGASAASRTTDPKPDKESSEKTSTKGASASNQTEKKHPLFVESQQLLHNITSYIAKQKNGKDKLEGLSVRLLEALVPLGSELLTGFNGEGLPGLMTVMTSLAEAGGAKGHSVLFTAATGWVAACREGLTAPEALEPGPRASPLVESAIVILGYVGEVVRAMVLAAPPPAPLRPTSPPYDLPLHSGALPEAAFHACADHASLLHPDHDWALLDDLAHEDDDDDESNADESDEDSLCNKLCTFTVTQKDFMNQHWYHCHTCKMVDGVGVCSVCARVCHRGHDVTYAKFGNFFCDCGARENGACQALVKRSGTAGNADNNGIAGATNPGNNGPGTSSGANPGTSSTSVAHSASHMESMLPSSLRRRPSSPTLLDKVTNPRDSARLANLAKLLSPLTDQLVGIVQKESVLVGPLVSLIKTLLPAVEASCQRTSPVGSHHRIQAALTELHTQDKKFQSTDQLMMPTLGSQEGAFENVKMSYSGEQGQTIRQLMSAHMIRRVAMCCLASPYGKRQHLAVSHEKGKITVLQLSALLKQADSSKRKLTLTRLSSAPIPFTVLSITGNPLNEDFLAVCGLKDCHVLTFTSGGSVADHLVLHPQLETGNFIMRAVWLPGSQTCLALVTADFVKIYDLSKDILSPQYYFLVPSGKIRDVSFACSETKSTMLLMSSAGYIYTQEMNEESSARHGPFYVTNTLELFHPEIKESNGHVCGGGVSVYYSHMLRLLFFSYSSGKSFIAPMEDENQVSLSTIFQVNLNNAGSSSRREGSSGSSGSNKSSSGGGTSSGGGAGGSSSSPSSQQPICQWTEVPNHPGLVCAVLQTSNNPVILMIKPDSILVQEIKVVPAKAKIMDMVAIRHPSSSSNEYRTTLILLCEDGSLRIYMASMEHTGFWLSPSMQPSAALTQHKSSKKKKTAKAGKPPGTVSFPVDYFEHCTQLNDVEFGGNDILQMYNPQQIKQRLNSTGQYIVSTKAAGFTIEITNNDATQVITGVRALVGNQDTTRVPTYLEVAGRSIPTTCTRNRWFDFPLTREESLQADKKLLLTFGPSQDPENVTMVDSVKVYGKSKDAFGWPEESEEVAAGTSASAGSSSEEGSASSSPVSSLDRMMSGMLEVLDGCCSLAGLGSDDRNPLRPLAISLATALLTSPTPACVQLHAKSLLCSLHASRASYHAYKDQAVLGYVQASLSALASIPNAADLDSEAFYRLVLMTRAIAIARPSNLLRYSQPPDPSSPLLVSLMMDVMWRLHRAQPSNLALASVCVPGLRHVEATVFSLVEIIHAFTIAEHSEAMSQLASKIYLELLLCQDTAVSFSAKGAIVRVLRPRVKRRRVFIPSPPHCSTPLGSGLPEGQEKASGPVSQPSQDSSEAEANQYDDPVEPVVLVGDPGAIGGVSVEALLGAGFPPMLDIPPDADDDTMVELAIALSLQDHQPVPANLQGLVAFHGGVNAAVGAAAGPAPPAGGPSGNSEPGHFSDTTASAGGSDDEGSTAATDGSTLRTSPADQGGSESGGSGVDSITGEQNVSGRSSAYGDNIQETLAGARSETSSLGAPHNFQAQEADAEAESEFEPEGGKTLHALRLATLERFVLHIPNIQDVGGVTVIPFMQVILVLTSDLDGEEERGRGVLESLLTSIISVLSMNSPDLTNIVERTKRREVQLVIMRLLSVLMSRPKANGPTPGSGPAPSSSKGSPDSSGFVCQTTANMLVMAGVVDYCLTLLKELIPYWKSANEEESSNGIGGVLLKAHLPVSPPDLSPFFVKQYVKGHGTDVFETYPQLLTEMALRLPYQVQKHTSAITKFSQSWFYYLCEYMMTNQAPFVRRQVRKLLLFICGNKEKYRQLRDLHSLQSHMKSVKSYVNGEEGTSCGLSYDALVEVTEHLKACVEVGTTRTPNWRYFCLSRDTGALTFLVEASCLVDEAVAATTLQLLMCGVCPQTPLVPGPKEPRPSTSAASDEDTQIPALVLQITSKLSRELLTRFMRTFLLETNSSSMRWQAHALLLALYNHSNKDVREDILNQLWSLWNLLPSYGRKASQFVDLLGYFSIKSDFADSRIVEYIGEAVDMLRTQNEVLRLHPNSTLYTHLANYVELEGYYLESTPCLVCNNPELPMTNIKLSSIKIDSKFTTTTQIVKLVSSHMISKISLRITDLKRTKMVRTMNIYYNNRSVQAVVELKNKPAMWNKAKKVSLASGQTEVKVEFPLPIVACNLMIEYSEFYENLQASSETLQCPRCSSSVPANPGVCANCGENVFQCHKCRAINYDEKDPFLCNACGFCKYAKFDFTLTGRPCCAVDPIENDEDRKKTVVAINSHLEKADRVYKQLVGNKPTLEMLLVKISEHKSERGGEENNSSTSNNVGGAASNAGAGPASANSGTGNNTMVNRAIQLLAQRYCTDCKTSFEELSRIIQKVMACRKKLVAYDRSQLEESGVAVHGGPGRPEDGSAPERPRDVQGRCYGCALAATEHCLILLKALASIPASKTELLTRNLVSELLTNNLRRGPPHVQEDVRALICLVASENEDATRETCRLLMARISLALKSHTANPDLASAVRPEINLLAALVHTDHSCWELKLRCVMVLFMMGCVEGASPIVVESVILPSLKILRSILKPEPPPSSSKYKDKPIELVTAIRASPGVSVDLVKWLQEDADNSFLAWRLRKPKRIEPPNISSKTKAEVRELYLHEKYARKWRERSLKTIRLMSSSWIEQILFNPSSRLARQVTCNMLETLCHEPVRKREVLDMLTKFLDKLGIAGESGAEYLALYQSLIQESPWKQYLALKGVLMHLANLITQEIEELHRLERTTLSSDLSQGYALKSLTELMASLLEQPGIKQVYKGRLVGAVLNGYLSLRRLVVQRTRLIDETQDKLLELLEEMTTGTEEETKAFMAICVQTVEKCAPDDVRTPVFVLERLCSIIFPEENDVGEFYLTLDKDPQQEDFLQGRMLGNPYSCYEPGLGPLMRDVKNKICQDCELVALLEDDNGMELLVNNKIISLDLPVKEVYKKIWVAEGGEGDSMKVVYRMRGLLGDATEEFVETLHKKSQQEVDKEEVYKMANVMGECGGLEVVLKRLAQVRDTTRSRQLLQVVLKLLQLCVQVNKNRELLCDPKLSAVSILLNSLQLCITDTQQPNGPLIQDILEITEILLSRAASKSSREYIQFASSLGGVDHVGSLLDSMLNCPHIKTNPTILHLITKVLAALTYANQEKMAVLMQHFAPAFNFTAFDSDHSPQDQQKLELFCNLTTGIDHTPLGNTLKDYILSLGIVEKALTYITMNAPNVKSTILQTDSDEWKEFISKPSLRYILRFLAGLSSHHRPTQEIVTLKCITIIHRLEGVSSDEHVGSLAENFLESLCTNESAARRIEEARNQTKAEKKRLAMAMREKQLGALGMRTNDKGQLTVDSTIMQQMEDLGEESGLVCVICREGYKFQPTKVLGVYTFTKRCNVEEMELKSRKTVGYTTVTHFNVVHIDCHMSAVRLARVRDEWESAALQNANTKCNGLLPLWGPQVPESAFASCLARHNTYLQEATGHRDISFASTVHDLKLLLLRFAQERSFHEDSGGGGPGSNMHIIPYLMHMALYVINTTRVGGREAKALASALDSPMERLLAACYEAEGPYYWTAFAPLLASAAEWNRRRTEHLRRLLVAAHVRATFPTGLPRRPTPSNPASSNNPSNPSNPEQQPLTPKPFPVYRAPLIFFALVDSIYKYHFKNVPCSNEDQWTANLADYIRHNDEALMKASEAVMAVYNDELLPCASFQEFCDVVGLLDEIPNPSSYLSSILAGI